MARYEIEVELSEQGIQHLKDVFTEYQNRLELVSKKFIEYSLDYLYKEACKNIDDTTGSSQWYQVTGTLKHSFTKSWTSFRGELVNTAKYASYVEYGTGGYASNGNGRKGGWAFTDNHGIVRFTYGMAPHWYLSNAIDSLLGTNAYHIAWDKAFDEVMGGLFK